MEKIRMSFQGVWNIVCFNRHFYLLSCLFVLCLLLLHSFLSTPYSTIVAIIASLVLLTTFISLLVSYYVYDLSGLYNLNWIDSAGINAGNTIVNINAGFDETSILLKSKFPKTELVVFDFYNPIKHTEVSIKRARKAYPPFEGTINVTTNNIPLPDDSATAIFLILAAHEIRNKEERIQFFIELRRILNQDGKIMVVEHLRDTLNFLAYTIGFFHFFSKSQWYEIFEDASLLVSNKKINPFITLFTLKKDGTTT